ncbi:hypothetical protein A3844_24955 [Paenibacillus helianthi]|uniref:Copper amine oxidase-like N-terminal domain-containing protein n=1 Tax=Paenibacillus helianthi TaxID=1349432 RepID=A0ABX3EGV0_9BACL|nr:hypothetical protein [Paenibacillus helianthi]OKP81837.1 hypothetical protein A3844_24955 [Paenibacillus helianthi]
MVKRIFVIFAMTIGLMVSADQSYARPTELPPSNDRTDVVYVSENVVTLVDYINNKADIVDLQTKITTNISDGSNTILDVKVIKNPQKIVLLQKGNGNKISKTVFSFSGNLISKTEIALENAGDKIRWVAPTGTTNERIMVQSNNSFSLYQYPWTKPSVSYNAKIVDVGYESVSVMDWEFEGYPNLAIKYHAQGIMRDDYFVKMVNLYSKNEASLKDFNSDFLIKTSGNYLAALSSYTYQAIPGNVIRPSANDSQKVFRVINKSTTKETASIKEVFKQDGDISGWKTELINGQVFVGDLLEHTWSLFSQEGAILLKKQDWPKNGATKFLYYNLKSQTAYFLDYSSGEISIMEKPSKK